MAEPMADPMDENQNEQKRDAEKLRKLHARIEAVQKLKSIWTEKYLTHEGHRILVVEYADQKGKPQVIREDVCVVCQKNVCGDLMGGVLRLDEFGLQLQFISHHTMQSKGWKLVHPQFSNLKSNKEIW